MHCRSAFRPGQIDNIQQGTGTIVMRSDLDLEYMVAARRHWIQTIVLHDSLLLAHVDLLQKFGRRGDRHPRLPDAADAVCTKVAYFYDTVAEQITDHVAVDLKGGDLDADVTSKLVLEPLDLCLDIDGHPWQNAGVLGRPPLLVKVHLLAGTLHCVRFTRPSLPVREDAGVLTIQRCLDEGLDLLEDLVLLCLS